MRSKMKKLKTNVKIQDNSTYLMLKSCDRYEATTTQFEMYN